MSEYFTDGKFNYGFPNENKKYMCECCFCCGCINKKFIKRMLLPLILVSVEELFVLSLIFKPTWYTNPFVILQTIVNSFVILGILNKWKIFYKFGLKFLIYEYIFVAILLIIYLCFIYFVSDFATKVAAEIDNIIHKIFDEYILQKDVINIKIYYAFVGVGYLTVATTFICVLFCKIKEFNKEEKEEASKLSPMVVPNFFF